LAGREGVRPAIAIVEHLCNYLAEGHIATLERQQSLIHFGINPDRSSLACTRHNYHFVVTLYKYFSKIITGFLTFFKIMRFLGIFAAIRPWGLGLQLHKGYTKHIRPGEPDIGKCCIVNIGKFRPVTMTAAYSEERR